MSRLKDLNIVLVVVLAAFSSRISFAAVVPGSTSDVEGRVFHGTIREDAESGDIVELDHELKVADGEDQNSHSGEVCGYTVYKTGVSPLPFKVILVDRTVGSAKIVLAAGFQLNYEQRQSYDFDIAADDCVSGAHGVRDHVQIAVEDVNEFAPEWKDQPYVAEVIEGRIQDEILHLDAVDADGSENFSKICQYHLLTTEVPFEISQNGVLRNTEPLDYNVKHNFILEIKAEDCGGRLSEKLLVNVLVKPACKTGWKGFTEHIEYETGSGRQALAPNASLTICEDVACEPTKVVSSVKLEVEQPEAESICEIDAESIESRNERCGISVDTVDLLKSVTSDSDNGVFAFDGKSVAHDVTDDVSFGAGGVASSFTVATWMKHEQGDDEELKQHVLCNADAEGMNRHHFSIYIHNCRLVMLLRQEPGPDVDPNVFKPAEWRWKMPQVCDGTWHHYAVSVDFPQVRLYVDGRLFTNDKHNFAVIDDWPLHPTKKVKSTRLVVGACWEGVGRHFGQYLRGELAGMVMINNHTEADQAIQCINSCDEKLDFHAINEMETGMSLSMNSAMSRLSISGHTKEGVEKLVERIGYVNGHSRPMTGTTTISMETSLTCKDGRDVPVPNVKVTVSAAAAVPKYTVTIGGTTQLVREERDVSHGTAVFRDLVILILPESSLKQDIDDIEPEALEASGKTKLDSCSVQVEPQMNEDMEHLRVPENLMKQLNIESEATAGGLVLTGEGKAVDYTEVLRGIHFVHSRPEDINMRIFRLTCTDLKNHFASNQLAVQLSVAHEDPEQQQSPAAPGPGRAAIEVNKLSHAAPNAKINELRSASSIAKHSTESAGAGVAVIAIVCIGFLIFLVVLGVARIRSAQRRSVEVSMDDRQEMEWDNSALNITVNPMDREAAYDDSEINGLQAGIDSDADTDDDIGSFHDDGPDSSDQEAGDDDGETINHGKSKDRDLEWDSSTVTY